MEIQYVHTDSDLSFVRIKRPMFEAKGLLVGDGMWRGSPLIYSASDASDITICLIFFSVVQLVQRPLQARQLSCGCGISHVYVSGVALPRCVMAKKVVGE